ncbi:MAG: ABC transporter ATP-binding protein [Gammaproteobacteria bacterium]|nr:ABC transporter ATP-binding protein [Gammaproteobacteria bacterium]
MLLEVQAVARAFAQGGRRIPVLEQVSLELAAGQRLTITGRSGSGKSTLLNLMAGLDLPDAGRIIWQVAGRSWNLAELDETTRTAFRRRHLGFVFQFFNLVPTLTALENVALLAELNGLDDPFGRARWRLQRLGLGDREDAFPDTLSGGEQQRVAIARALVHEPAVILADEPTGNLDRETGDAVFAQLLEVLAEEDRALVLVTHDPELAAGGDAELALGRTP